MLNGDATFGKEAAREPKFSVSEKHGMYREKSLYSLVPGTRSDHQILGGKRLEA